MGRFPFHRFYSITQPRNSAGKFKGPRLGNCDTNFSAVLVLRLGGFPTRNRDVGFKQNMLDKDKRKCLWNLVSFFGWTMKNGSLLYLFLVFVILLFLVGCIFEEPSKHQKDSKRVLIRKTQKKYSSCCIWTIQGQHLEKVAPYLMRLVFHMDVSKNSGTPESSILIGFSIINHPFWGTPIFGNTHMFHPTSVPALIMSKPVCSKLRR